MTASSQRQPHTLVLIAVATANHEYMPSGPHAPIVVAIRTLNSTKSVMGFSRLLEAHNNNKQGPW